MERCYKLDLEDGGLPQNKQVLQEDYFYTVIFSLTGDADNIVYSLTLKNNGKNLCILGQVQNSHGQAVRQDNHLQ
jgi:hypothetical protein